MRADRLGFGMGIGLPIGASNMVSLSNRIGPQRLKWLLTNPGTIGQRAAPGACRDCSLSPDEQK